MTGVPTLTRCPRCLRPDTVIVYASVPFVVGSQSLTGQYFGKPWGSPDIVPLHVDSVAICNAYGCNWKGTLADALEAASA